MSRPFPVAAALREAVKRGYSRKVLQADALSGLVVGVVAIPLSMALAIAVGVPPQHGLYTAVVAGFVVALLGGSMQQVTGPTAAFIVILAPIVAKHGLSGLLVAGFLAGAMLVGMGLGRLGRLIQFIPGPVTAGFTAGIAVVIATLQLRDALGLEVASMPDDYAGKVRALVDAAPTLRVAEVVVTAATFAVLLLFPRVTKRIPAPLVALACAGAGVALARKLAPGFEVATIGSRFSTVVDGVTVAGIPSVLPAPRLPWGELQLSWSMVRELLPSAFAIAILGAIESLLSAVIADGMSGNKHDPDSELFALGIGNLLAPCLGGIAATGALARTATNVRSGGKTPVASMIHALVVLASVVALAPLVAYVPMASLAALLLVVAWNMSEARHVVHTLRVAPKSDIVVLLTCFGLTVAFDMVIAVSVGVVLGALLFMRRMAELTSARPLLEGDTQLGRPVPATVGLYEIRGPLFFGAARSAMDELVARSDDSLRVVVLSLGATPAIDATGLAALESAVQALVSSDKIVILAGPMPEPRAVWTKARLEERYPGTRVAPTLDAAIDLALAVVAEGPSSLPSPSAPPEPVAATGPTGPDA